MKLHTKIEFLKGVGPKKAELLHGEIGISTLKHFIHYYPFRYEDRSKFQTISQVPQIDGSVQIKGILKSKEVVGGPRKKRLVAKFTDSTGDIELIWFKGVTWILGKLKEGIPYIIYGKANFFNGHYNISHPEMEVLTPTNEAGGGSRIPVYSTTEKLKNGFLDSRALSKLQVLAINSIQNEIKEFFPPELTERYKMIDRLSALRNIHFPTSEKALNLSRFRLKFEELFFIQVKLLRQKGLKKQQYKGIIMHDSKLVSKFYNEFLPFELTNAQKTVIKEIYADMRSGIQMNRLMQGDVGSGKTIAAFICMLIAIGCETQTALMAPTEILAHQHYQGLKVFADQMGLEISLVTGSTRKKARKEILEGLRNGRVHIIVGTHALLEDDVQFLNLGLAVIDEQHRFGVAQRARLWKKNTKIYPHVLVMTATPIPRTLAMTLYGDLDISVIDELPKGRKPIETAHMRDGGRLKLFGFIRQQIDLGRQVYIVYPLIEESKNFDFKDLMDGYESISRAFPDPISILHGKMKPADKDFEMERFVKGETKILVATTVIEVGVNVPNASVMVIENAERFGLSQLHQLRGRVGRGADQSYCILMTSDKLSREAKERVRTMVSTNDGFEIAETDLRLRGPGDLTGTQQSGVLDLNLADLATDGKILEEARLSAEEILTEDPNLEMEKHGGLKKVLDEMRSEITDWSLIS